jgi:hypothetical protein
MLYLISKKQTKEFIYQKISSKGMSEAEKINRHLLFLKVKFFIIIHVCIELKHRESDIDDVSHSDS